MITRGRRLWLLGALLAGWGAAAGLSAAQAGPINRANAGPVTADSPAGKAIYNEGVLPSGEPLTGSRVDSQALSGAEAACVSCHRRSGLGSQEGRSIIPPITGQFLFHVPAGRMDTDAQHEVELPFVPGARPDRRAYDDATLARAVRDGVDAEGRIMSSLMPRYALNDADVAALITHLRALDRRREPGVSETELHFATIVTPDADPLKRRAMLDVLNQFFEDRNNTQRLPSAQSMMPSGNAYRVKNMFKVTRRWVLHVWEPTGPKDTWTAQLQKSFESQPVFAVLSGLGGTDWSPVQTFCEKAAVPCLFPNVELPPADAERQFYSLYFSRGVRLEADLIAQDLMGAAAAAPPSGSKPLTVKTVRQVYRQGDVGAAAAAALTQSLRSSGLTVQDRAIPAGAAASAVAAALRDVSEHDAVVLWLRPGDLSALPAAAPAAVYLSAVMSDVDSVPLAPAWRSRSHIAYPFDLPESRRVRVDYALGWFRVRKIPVVSLQVQADTYLACGLATETIKHMVDTFVPDYLVERLEDTAEHRIITGYYPRLSLGPHQRFASKGGFLVHVGDDGRRLVADGEWTIP